MPKFSEMSQQELGHKRKLTRKEKRTQKRAIPGPMASSLVSSVVLVSSLVSSVVLIFSLVSSVGPGAYSPDYSVSSCVSPLPRWTFKERTAFGSMIPPSPRPGRWGIAMNLLTFCPDD